MQYALKEFCACYCFSCTRGPKLNDGNFSAIAIIAETRKTRKPEFSGSAFLQVFCRTIAIVLSPLQMSERKIILYRHIEIENLTKDLIFLKFEFKTGK